ncbi:GNAT family N-acetyltransferase [bacterium]|nr:GNAT family N-acetyltransferase [bacterium]
MIKGKVVGLRAIEKEDLPVLLEWRNNPSNRSYFREVLELSSQNQEQWFQTRVLNNSNNIMFAIQELKTGKLLGVCGLCYINWINRSADFSIYIGHNELYIDEKFAPEAAILLIEYAFKEINLHRLSVEVYEIDKLKQNLMEKIGFKKEGCHIDTYWHNGEWVNSLFYGLIYN